MRSDRVRRTMVDYGRVSPTHIERILHRSKPLRLASFPRAGAYDVRARVRTAE